MIGTAEKVVDGERVRRGRERRKGVKGKKRGRDFERSRIVRRPGASY
jgi:hypothetical protein